MIEMLFMILKRVGVGFIVIMTLEEDNHSSREVAEV
jgi:hypothetical protein